MHLILLHSGTFHSGTKASWFSRLISFCMLTILPLQLLSLLCCSNSQTVKAKWYFFCSFEYEALMSLHHVSVFSDSVQHFLILVTQLVRQCRNFTLLSLWEIVALEETSLMPYCKLWPDYFLTFPRAEDCTAKLRDTSINTVVISQHSLSFTNLAGC